MGFGTGERKSINTTPGVHSVQEQYGIPLGFTENYSGVEHDRKCMDAAFAIGFVLFCIALLSIGVFTQTKVHTCSDWPSGNLTSYGNGTAPTPPGPSPPTPTRLCDVFDMSCQTRFLGEDAGIISGCVILSCLVAFLWMWLIRRFPKPMIYGSMLGTILLWIGLAVFMFTYADSIYSGIVFLVLAALYLLYIFLLRRRIQFTAILLTEASHAIGSNLLLVVFVAPVILAVSVGYMGFFCWTSYTQLRLSFECGDEKTNWTYLIFWFVNVFGLYWVSNVIMGVYNVTIAGTVANWYFTHASNGQSVGACMAFGWAVTKNFGSICLGSLILAIIEFCRFLLRLAERSDNGYVAIIACCLRCLCWLIQSIIEYITRYAYIYIAMYSTSFISSARQVWSLFGRSGWQAVTNDIVLGPVTIIGSLVGTMIGGGACALIVLAWGAPFHWLSVAVCSLVCYVIWLQLARILITSVDTVFVCYMEDLERNAEQNRLMAEPGLIAAISAHPKTPAKYKNLNL